VRTRPNLTEHLAHPRTQSSLGKGNNRFVSATLITQSVSARFCGALPPTSSFRQKNVGVESSYSR